jgi:hypothetical protein
MVYDHFAPKRMFFTLGLTPSSMAKLQEARVGELDRTIRTQNWVIGKLAQPSVRGGNLPGNPVSRDLRCSTRPGAPLFP